MFDYQIQVDTERDGSFSSGLDDITQKVINCEWSYGLNSPWEHVGAGAYLRLTLDNQDARFSLADSSAIYYGKMNHGTLVRVRVTLNGLTTTLAVMKVKHIRYLGNAAETLNASEHQVQLICEDPVDKFLKDEFIPALRFDVRVDEALHEIFEQSQFIYPYDGAWFYIGTSEIGGTDEIYDYTQENLVDFDEAFSTLPYAGDNLDRGSGAKVQSYIRDLMKAEFQGIFFWDIRNEQFKFFNRYHSQIVQISPFLGRESSYLFDMEDIHRAKPEYGENLINEVTVHFYPREIGTPGSVVASSNSVPITFPAQDERTIRLRYRDPNNPDATIGAMDVLPLVADLDFIGNSEPDGSGEDWTRFIIIIGVEIGAESVEIKIFNRKVGEPLYITQFQIRGTPIIAYKRETVSVTDGESRRLYDKAIMTPENARLITDSETATAYATMLLNRLKTPDLFFKSITLVAKRAEIAEQIQLRSVGDLITVMDARGVNTKYMIVGERHTIRLEENLHMAEWVLRPSKYGNIFIIGESEIGGTDLILG